MTRALVIYGDMDIGNAIAEPISKRVVTLDGGEMAALRAELDHLRDRNALRVYGDERRFKTTRRRLARKYRVKPVRPIHGVFLGLYGLLCLWVAEGYARLAAWNRG